MFHISLLFRVCVVLLFCGGMLASGAERQVMISAQFKELTKNGEDVLSAPRVITKSGQTAVVSMQTQMQSAGLLKSGEGKQVKLPGSANPKDPEVATKKFETGVMLEVTPFIIADRIEYHGVATVRSFLGYQGDKENPVASFVTREIHFAGVADDRGEKRLKMQGAGQAKEFELLLTFNRVDPEALPAVRKAGLRRP